MDNKSSDHSSWVSEDILSNPLFLFSLQMRNLFFLLGLIFFTSCSTDVVAPCGTDHALFGRICSEFKSRNDVPVGTVDYVYSQNGNALITDYVDPNGNVERTVRYTFKDAIVVTERETINGEEKTKSYSYNDHDSISSIAYFTGAEIDSIAFCDFENGKRVRVRVQVGEEILRFADFRYDSGGTLNRVSNYAADSSLLGYLQYEFYGNNKIRIKKRTPQHLLIHTDNIELNSLNQIEQNVRRSGVGDTILVVSNTFNRQGKLFEKTLVTPSESTSIRYYYYE